MSWLAELISNTLHYTYCLFTCFNDPRVLTLTMSSPSYNGSSELLSPTNLTFSYLFAFHHKMHPSFRCNDLSLDIKGFVVQVLSLMLLHINSPCHVCHFSYFHSITWDWSFGWNHLRLTESWGCQIPITEWTTRCFTYLHIMTFFLTKD